MGLLGWVCWWCECAGVDLIRWLCYAGSAGVVVLGCVGVGVLGGYTGVGVLW